MTGRRKLVCAALALSALAYSDQFVASALAAETFWQLKGRQIMAQFSGMEFTDEIHFAEEFKRDGTLSGAYMGRSKVGQWRAVRDELCLSRGGDEERCYAVWLSGKKVQLRPSRLGLSEDGVLKRPASASAR